MSLQLLDSLMAKFPLKTQRGLRLRETISFSNDYHRATKATSEHQMCRKWKYMHPLRTMREELASLGTILSELDFSATILGSLPKTYDQFLSAITVTASAILKRDLDREELIQAAIDEYNRRSTRSNKDKGDDAAFYAKSNNNRGKTSKKSNKKIECFNYHKWGHKKADCWAKGKSNGSIVLA